MPTPKSLTENTSGHIHQWVANYDRTSFKCIASYNGRMCIKLKVSAQELERRIEEYNNYYDLCRTTEARRDYEDMRKAFKANDKAWIKQIMARVETRCKVVAGYDGLMDQDKYEFNESEYLSKPAYPDPMHPKGYYQTA